MDQSNSPQVPHESNSANAGNGNLPNPKLLRWAHSTCSSDQLDSALLDDNVTAIEADIVMGHEEKELKEVTPSSQPIMAHPPLLTSDLTFEEFIRRSLSFGKELLEDSKDSSDSFQSDFGPVKKHKHLKLDFKDAETIHPSFNTLKKAFAVNETFDKTIFLNADILKGPGRRCAPLSIDAHDFLKASLQFLDSMSAANRKRFAMSLGWRTDCRSFHGYTRQDVDEMIELVETFDLLEKTAGVVLAVNARVLAKDPTSFDSILKRYPTMQLLVWTGTGEPPISETQISSIKEYFHCIGFEDQLGFDCQVSISKNYFHLE